MSSDATIKDAIVAVADARLSPANSAEQIAQAVVQQEQRNTEGGLYTLWTSIIDTVTSTPTAQPHLVSLLVLLSQLPDAVDSRGSVIVLYGRKLWGGLPMFGWEINGIWDGRDIPTAQPQRQEAIDVWVHKVHFTALLVATNQPVFQDYRLQILWTFRALESPSADVDSSGFAELDIGIPAIAVVVNVLGADVRSWADEYPTSALGGAPGSGGPLWDGKHGFSTKRYDLWRRRLEEIGRQAGVEASIQRLAAEAIAKM